MTEYNYKVKLEFNGVGLEVGSKAKAIRQIKAIFDDEHNLKIKNDEIIELRKVI